MLIFETSYATLYIITSDIGIPIFIGFDQCFPVFSCDLSLVFADVSPVSLIVPPVSFSLRRSRRGSHLSPLQKMVF